MTPQEKELQQLRARVAQLEEVLREVDAALRVPAAEYVPAISDAFAIIDRAALYGREEKGKGV